MTATLADATTQVMLPADATWSGVVLLCAAGLTLAALVIGLASRAVAPEAYDDTGPQDEPDEAAPGSDAI